MPKYFGEYADFETTSKKDSGLLIGADNMVGDIYDIKVKLEDGIHKGWLDNRFDQRIGYLDQKTSRQVSLMAADGMVCKAILSFVAFSSTPGEGHYWGQVAIICYNPAYESEFDTFIKGVAAKISDDVRPKLDFESEGVEKVIESGGTWLPSQTVPLPETSKQMSIIKRRRKFSDRMIEQGRAGNKGCYVFSWVFLLAVVALIVFAFKGCMGW